MSAHLATSPTNNSGKVTMLAREMETMENHEHQSLPPSLHNIAVTPEVITPEANKEEQEYRTQMLYKMRLRQLGNHHVAEEKLRVRKEKWKKNIKKQRKEAREQQEQHKQRQNPNDKENNDNGILQVSYDTTELTKKYLRRCNPGALVEGDGQLGKILDFVNCSSLVGKCNEYANCNEDTIAFTDASSIVDQR
mmetsp:Transcript_757/g.1103  ORF Transcript_757/g.1103 Transcript_757/m.1103 type:complete len:193 (-) Transcript_757:1272-1850(-)